MTFELTEYNEVRLATFTKRVEKHGDEDKQAVSLGLEITTENFVLDLIDPSLRHALYKAKDVEQGELPEVTPSTPVLRSSSVERVVLPNKHEGWTLEVDANGNEEDTMKFGGCKLSKFAVEPKQGGTVVMRFMVGTSDLDGDRLGWLGMHHGELIYVKLHAPKAPEDAIDGTQAAFDEDHQADATDLFVDEHAPA